jgi:tRNA-Thr(GGU) m(6)t(6)A37 methyltransferase TsaA
MVKPFMDDVLRGVFATRAPRRPNPIGLSIVRLVRKEGCTLFVEDVDMLDGTPLLDIKPYVPEFDAPEATRTGWLRRKSSGVKKAKSDNRFT